jgi:GDPmannose 4,6-dehydratase
VNDRPRETAGVADRVALVFGVSGQDGAYLSRFLVTKGYRVHGTTRQPSGARLANLESLGIGNRIAIHAVNPRDADAVMALVRAVQPHEVFDLTGPSSVGYSFAHPDEVRACITACTTNILDALAAVCGEARFYNACTSESFGDTGASAADEETPLRPVSPYGAAKADSFERVAEWRSTRGLFGCSGILFNHESPLRPANFVSRKIVSAAAAVADGRELPLVLGDLNIVRDWGWSPEYVEAMWLMLQQDHADDYVVATGESNGLSEFVAAAFGEFGLDWRRHVRTDPTLFRPAEIALSAANPTKAGAILGWRAKSRMADVVRMMTEAERARPRGAD